MFLPPENEPACQSPFDSTPTGCCVDGRRCDEVCIAIVAAEECKQADHTYARDLECQNGCCQGEIADPCDELQQLHLVEQVSGEEQDLCCKDEKSECTSKTTSGSCCGNRKADQIVSPAQTAKDTCCKPEKGTADNVDQRSSSQHSAETTAVVDESDDECSKIENSCCNTDAMACASTSPSADLSIITEFQEACATHLADAMERYKGYLKSGMCICRNALRQVNVCCNQDSRAAILGKRKALPTASKSCCVDTNVPVKRCKLNNGRSTGTQTACSKNTSLANCTKDQQTSKKICCSTQTDCCKPVNSDSSDPLVSELVTTTKPREAPEFVDSTQDVESGAAREHVTFNITGMTCTGCVKKIIGVLRNFNGVDNAKVNFVAAIGEVDVDTTKIAAVSVLRRLEKETGFTCSRIITEYQTLDLNMSSAAARVFAADLPGGIDSVDRIARDVHRVSYNPLLIGARAVLARSNGQLAPPNNDGAVNESRRRLMLMLRSFLGATLFTIPVCVLAFSDIHVPLQVKRIIELVLASFVQLIAVPEFYMPALKALIFSKVIEMDMLVVVSITAAYFYSIVAFGLELSGINLEQGPLFETSTLLITLILLGRLVASCAKVKAVQAVSLKSLQAELAILEDVEGKTTEIDARLLEFNDVVHIPAHTKIVSDGHVINGESTVDESMLTGESLPVLKTAGDAVTAGTLNGPGVLRIRLTRLPGKNSITDIAELVQSALNSKPRVQDLADTIAGYFVPVVVSISVVVFAVWIVVALRVRNENAGGAVGTAITYAIAVMAVSCPCALGLAVPLVLIISGGLAAQRGVIIKQAHATERSFKVTDIVFDKTGTLTTGQLEVIEQIMHTSSFSSRQILAVAYSLVKDDTHPVAQAVFAKLRSQDISQEAMEAVKSVSGCGIEAMWKGQQAKAGNPYWLGIDTDPSVATLRKEGYTLLCVTIGGQLVVSFGLTATIRSEAQSVVSALQERNLTCHIVSGDHPTAVSNVATTLSISHVNTASRQSPVTKQMYIRNLKSAGKTVLFVGDGTNDAVAVAEADIGVQIGAASDVTRATADVVLLGGLESIVTLLEVSRKSFYRIVFNFVWSAVYNLFAILLASGAFVKVRIAPRYAGLGEVVSVLPVVFAALTMLEIKMTLS